TTDWALADQSDLVIITSGMPRKAGMSRDDLLAKNTAVVQSVSAEVRRRCPEAVVIVVCNPLDAMVYTAAKVTGFAVARVLGMAGALDAARYAYFIAEELGVWVGDVHAVLMGGHGDDMVPLPRYTSVSGVPVTELMEPVRIAAIIARTRRGGMEIVELLGTSAYYAPAAGAVRMAEAILADRKAVMCCSAWCEAEYDVGGAFVGVPVVLGAAGVERIIELELHPAEREAFATSAAHVKALTAKVDALLAADKD
ncbi:MAG TPA: malate dehydrogenase, partial [Phycisphaerales bacterium]|nr:malate dehydrogenase [Phycisphaerales bacterium]